MGKRVENLKENRKKGISMAIVLCAAAFLVAFAAAIVYTAGLLTAEANERLEQERCYQLAKSYAKVLDTELTSYTLFSSVFRVYEVNSVSRTFA